MLWYNVVEYQSIGQKYDGRFGLYDLFMRYKSMINSYFIVTKRSFKSKDTVILSKKQIFVPKFLEP